MPRGHITRVTLPYLRAWRIKRLLSQSELAEMSHIAKSTLARLEKGDQTAILSTVGKLAKALNISREELVFHDPESPAGVTPERRG
jgi:transcriptional regulator with XRE-family HTH domain